MLAAGATPMCCPHCGAETPVYESDYDESGDPVSFSVCLWCDGLVEFDARTGEVHEPYEDPAGVRMNHADRSD
ncbi:MAG: hypothetical protein ABEJ28_07040 [Salinigranum sp.]